MLPKKKKKIRRNYRCDTLFGNSILLSNKTDKLKITLFKTLMYKI